ncbi:MAG TPA: (Fe-S)-binding protein [Bacteroidales bacterium]|nr:(Fe-S)-binding protein [Bacteroidales bacterium]HRX96973.1 (Fe-S)-binding protein [Bacteroidales bacterium]
MTVDIFIPCFIDQIYPETGMNMVKILEKLGVTVNYNSNQTCCGQMAFNSGFWDEAKDMGEKFIKDFPNDRPVVAPSASCVGYVKNYYGKLFFNTGLHLEYKRLQKNIFELSDFLVNKLNVTDLGATFKHKVTYHDSCASLREYKLKDEPRKLLAHVKGLELVEMKDTHVCCGFGGTFSVKHEAISTAMAEQKVQHALDTEAEFIISTDSSCLMHQEGYINKHKLPIKVIHLADVLAAGW